MKRYYKIIIIQILIIISILLIYLFVKLDFVKFLPECYWLTNYNFYCPSCGSTRCMINLVDGNFLQAFQSNPFFFIFIIYLLIVDLIYLFNTIFNKNLLHFLYPNKWWKIVGFFVIWIIYTIILNIY